MEFGHFDDAAGEYVITHLLTPRPWINYLGNRRLSAFISQQAGGLLWYLEPQSRRLSRYHYVAAPGDQPGFYVYVRNRATGTVWNPHLAPTFTPLDHCECRHAPGQTRFVARKEGIAVEVRYGIPPAADVMLWRVTVTNDGSAPADVQLISYLEFGLLEFMREAIGWCYLKSHCAFSYDPTARAIRYDYHVFEAPFTPRMAFGCTAPVAAWDCAREAFLGPTGSLASPETLRPGRDLTNSALPLGGHGCGTLAVDLHLAPAATQSVAYVYALGEQWAQTDALLARYAAASAVEAAFADIADFRRTRLGVCQVATGDPVSDRFINTWNPANCLITLEHARIISTDHAGLDGLRYRDSTQDALAVASLDLDFAKERMRQVFGQQTADGGGCFAFWPYNRQPTSDIPRRSDNTVWQLDTVLAICAESGDCGFLEERIPFRDAGEGTVYEHLRRGLQCILGRLGPHGLPLLFDADWNDGLALFGDPKAESVMLAMQLVAALRGFGQLARRLGRDDADCCAPAAAALTAALNSDAVWDGAWYRRLLLSNGRLVGSARNRQGSIFLNPQSWAIISGVGEADGRGRQAMAAAHERLNSPCGLCLLAPPYRGFPEPEDAPLGSSPGTNENGSIFCHANTWAIIATALLGDADRAWAYYRQLLPENVIARVGAAHYQREPYVCVSSIIGPVSDRFGQGGISWLTGTASWLYVAATQYLLGLRPTLDGLAVRPCLPPALREVRAVRRFRGCTYEITFHPTGRRQPRLLVDGRLIQGDVLPVTKGRCQVECEY